MLHVQHDKSNNYTEKDRNSDDDFIDEELQNEVIHEFLFPESVCAIVSNKKSTDTVCFLKIVQEGIADENMYDKSDHCVIQGHLLKVNTETIRRQEDM